MFLGPKQESSENQVGENRQPPKVHRGQGWSVRGQRGVRVLVTAQLGGGLSVVSVGSMS